jgi:hypothetical protein
VHQGKGRAGKFRETGISDNLVVKHGEDQGVSQLKGLSIQLFSSNYKDFCCVAAGGNSLFQGVDNFCPGGRKRGVPGHHYIASTGQGATNGLPSLSPHDQAMPHGDLFKTFLFPGDVPGDGVVAAYDIICGQGGNKDDFHFSSFVGVFLKYPTMKDARMHFLWRIFSSIFPGAALDRIMMLLILLSS